VKFLYVRKSEKFDDHVNPKYFNRLCTCDIENVYTNTRTQYPQYYFIGALTFDDGCRREAYIENLVPLDEEAKLYLVKLKLGVHDSEV